MWRYWNGILFWLREQNESKCGKRKIRNSTDGSNVSWLLLSAWLRLFLCRFFLSPQFSILLKLHRHIGDSFTNDILAKYTFRENGDNLVAITRLSPCSHKANIAIITREWKSSGGVREAYETNTSRQCAVGALIIGIMSDPEVMGTYEYAAFSNNVNIWTWQILVSWLHTFAERWWWYIDARRVKKSYIHEELFRAYLWPLSMLPSDETFLWLLG